MFCLQWWVEFKCFLTTGHKWDQTGTRRQASHAMNNCEHCKQSSAGPDLYG